MKRILKDFKRFKKKPNPPSSGYLYLKATKKVHAEIKERTKQHQAHHAAQEKKHSTASTTQSNLSLTPKARTTRPSAKVPSATQIDALKSENCVQSDKKASASVKEQPAKTKSVFVKQKSVPPTTDADTDHQTAQRLDQKQDNSLPDSMPLYNKQRTVWVPGHRMRMNANRRDSNSPRNTS